MSAPQEQALSPRSAGCGTNTCSIRSTPMHFEVDVVVQHPLDHQAERFLTSVQRSANRVIRFRGDDHRIVITVEAHAFDREGAVRAAIQEIAHIYPLVKFEADGEPRPLRLARRSG